jgi:hypothetical protein
MDGRKKPPAGNWRRKGNGGDNARKRPVSDRIERPLGKGKSKSVPSRSIPVKDGRSPGQWYIKVALENGNFALTWRVPRTWRKTPVEVVFEGALKVSLPRVSAVVGRLITIASAMVHLLRAFGVI